MGRVLGSVFGAIVDHTMTMPAVTTPSRPSLPETLCREEKGVGNRSFRRVTDSLPRWPHLHGTGEGGRWFTGFLQSSYVTTPFRRGGIAVARHDVASFGVASHLAHDVPRNPATIWAVRWIAEAEMSIREGLRGPLVAKLA